MSSLRRSALVVLILLGTECATYATPSPRGEEPSPAAPSLPAEAAAPSEVEIEEPPENSSSVEVRAVIDSGGRLVLKTTVTASGPESDALRQGFWVGADFVRELAITLGSVQAEQYPVEPYEISHSDPRELSQPVQFSYGLGIAGFALEGEVQVQRSLPSAFLRGTGFAFLQLGAPVNVGDEALPIGGPKDLNETIELTLDEGDTITAPTPFRLDRDFARYESAYSVEAGTLRARRSLRIRFESLPSTRRTELLSFAKAMMKDLDQVVDLRLARARDPRAIAQDLDAAALIDLGKLAFDRRDLRLAQELLQKATSVAPENAYAWALLGQIHIHERSGTKAVAALENARRLRPNDTRFHQSLALAYTISGRSADALAALRQGLAVDPLDTDMQYRLAWLLERQRDWPGAAEAYERLVSLAPDEPRGVLGAARTQRELGNADAARDRLQRALQLELSSDDRLEAARVLAHPGIDPARADEVLLGIMKEAASICRSVSLDHVPDDYWYALGELAEAYQIRGEGRMEAQQYDEAIKNLQVAYDIYPRDDVTRALAEAHARKGDPETALRYFAMTGDARPRDRAIEFPPYLASYVMRKYPDPAAREQAVMTLGKERLFQRKVETTGGPFRVPAQYPGDMGHDFKMLLLVDENGIVEDHRAQGGRDPFLASAIRDLHRVRFKPVGLPEAPVKTLRVVEFFYLPIKEVRAFWEFAPPPDLRREEWAGE